MTKVTFHLIENWNCHEYNKDKGEDDEMSKESGLTKRQKTIIKMLAQFTFSNPVTVQAISEKLNLSSRTILRDLPEIEKWMEANDFHLVRKPRVGIYLDEEEENRNLILELVDVDTTKTSTMDKKERIFQIESEILASKEPLKYYYFTSKFGISEGTLSSDLDEIETWYGNYGVKLVRRKGLGVYWEGSEQDYRQAAATILLEDMLQKEAMRSDDEEKKSSNPLSTLYPEEYTRFIQDVIKTVEQNLAIRYTDNAFKRLAVIISISIYRMCQDHMIIDFMIEIETLMQYPEYQCATWVGSMLEATFDLTITQEEIAFLTMQFLSAKVWQPQIKEKYGSENLKNRQLVIHMILKVEKLLDIDFLNDRMLIDGLCNHIGPALSRIKMNIRIENHNVDMLKDRYSEIYEAVQEAANILKNELELDSIREEEIGFIALHFCAAIEKQRAEGGKVSVIVACPNGVGTSHMLAVHLQKAFPEIVVRKVIAASELDLDYLNQEGIELIISTVQLNVEFPYVCVNSVLLENDRILVRNQLKEIRKYRNIHKQRSKVAKRRRVRRNEMEYFRILAAESLQVVDNIKISPLDCVESKDVLLKEAGKLFARNDQYATWIEGDLRHRESVAHTYISTFQMYFFHSRSKGVKHCRFGYIALKEPLITEEGPVQGAIVMLIPFEEGEQQRIYQEVMSEVSGALAENELIRSNLCKKEREIVSFEFEKCLGNYYQSKMQEYGGI